AFSVPTVWRTADPDPSPTERSRDPAPTRRVAAGIKPEEWSSEEATVMEESERRCGKKWPCHAAPRQAAPCHAPTPIPAPRQPTPPPCQPPPCQPPPPQPRACAGVATSAAPISIAAATEADFQRLDLKTVDFQLSSDVMRVPPK